MFFRFSVGSAPICLRQINDESEIDVTILGYGKVSYLGMVARILQEAELKTMKNEECRKAYSDEDGIEISESQICANDPEELGRDSWYSAKSYLTFLLFTK